jgi:hypothetical protein
LPSTERAHFIKASSVFSPERAEAWKRWQNVRERMAVRMVGESAMEDHY